MLVSVCISTIITSQLPVSIWHDYWVLFKMKKSALAVLLTIIIANSMFSQSWQAYEGERYTEGFSRETFPEQVYLSSQDPNGTTISIYMSISEHSINKKLVYMLNVQYNCSDETLKMCADKDTMLSFRSGTPLEINTDQVKSIFCENNMRLSFILKSNNLRDRRGKYLREFIISWAENDCCPDSKSVVYKTTKSDYFQRIINFLEE